MADWELAVSSQSPMALPQGDHAFVAVRVFRVPTQVPGSALEQLLADFWTAVDDWRT